MSDTLPERDWFDKANQDLEMARLYRAISVLIALVRNNAMQFTITFARGRSFTLLCAALLAGDCGHKLGYRHFADPILPAADLAATDKGRGVRLRPVAVAY